MLLHRQSLVNSENDLQTVHKPTHVQLSNVDTDDTDVIEEEELVVINKQRNVKDTVEKEKETFIPADGCMTITSNI